MPEEFYVNRSGLDEVGLDLSTRQGDQVLAIDAANGILLIRVKDDGYRGVLAITKDSSQASIHASKVALYSSASFSISLSCTIACPRRWQATAVSSSISDTVTSVVS